MSDQYPQRILPKAALRGWLERLLASYRLVGPVADTETVTSYRPVGPETMLRLSGPRPTASPKTHLLPQTETLFTFQGSGPALALTAAEPAATPTVIFGVRPCDARALRRLDDVFLGRTERDAPDIDNEVYISSPQVLRRGVLQAVRIEDATEYDLYGSAVQDGGLP